MVNSKLETIHDRWAWYRRCRKYVSTHGRDIHKEFAKCTKTNHQRQALFRTIWLWYSSRCRIKTVKSSSLAKFDIIYSKFYSFKRWLIEINASPSLTASSQDDFELKFRLLDDTLTIVDMENRLVEYY